MDRLDKPKQVILFWRYAIGAALAWTAIIGGSLTWNYVLLDRQANDLLHNQAVANFNKDQAFRNWGTKHGGLYAPITEDTPPSPSMAHMPERDIVTPSGKKLTLMNPAYMLRQLMQEYTDLYDIKGKITGLVLLRPENAPDPWEREALLQLKDGADEVLEYTEIDGVPHLRMMRPMYMLPGCDKCHGHLGFKTGDFRGGVSVSVPAEPYITARDDTFSVLATTHFAGWLLGLVGVGFAGRQVRLHIGESLHAEEALKASESKLSEILRLAPEAVVATDGNGKLKIFNKGAERIFGYTAEEVLGEPVDVLIPERLRPVHGNHVKEFVKGKEHLLNISQRSEISGKRKDGSEFPAAASVAKLLTADELLLIIVLHDITDQKLAERALVEAKEEAEEASRAKTEFLAHMSHEFRTPLNAIVGFSSIIVDETLGRDHPKYREYVKDIHSSGTHMTQLISDILDVARIEAVEIELDENNCNVAGIIQDCVNMTSEAAGSAEVSLQVDVPDDLPGLQADQRRTKQILINLLSNSIKFTNPGGEIHVSAFVDEKGQINISVADTGVGIAESAMPHIFEPFYQARQDSQRSFQPGSGLGLPLVKSLIEMHGGNVTVDSILHEGTRITIRFPAGRTLVS